MLSLRIANSRPGLFEQSLALSGRDGGSQRGGWSSVPSMSNLKLFARKFQAGYSDQYQ